MKNIISPKFFLVTLVLLLSAPLAHAVIYYSSATGSPTTLTLWWTATNGTGTNPANFTTAGDVFTIQNTHIMTTTANWTVTGTVVVENGGRLAATSTGTTLSFGAFTINAGGIVTINRPLTVTGATNISGTINFASTSGTARAITLTGDVTLNSGAVWTTPATGNGATNTYNFGGNFTNNAFSFNDLGTGVHTFSGATKAISGATITSIGSVAITGTLTNSGTLTVRTALSGAGALTNGNGTTGTLNIGGTATVTTLTATAANNLVNYTGVAQTAKVTTYNNLTLSGSLVKTFATTPTVNGVLSLEGTATVVVTTGVVTYGSAATLQYNTATARTATAEEWITPFAGSGGIIIKTGAITTPGAVQIGNNTSVSLNINSGATLTPGANLLTFHGDFINAGTLTSGTGGVTIAGTTATQSIAGFTTTGTVSLTKSAGNATFQGNVNGGPLTINGSGTGTLNLGAGLTHTFTGDVNFLGGSLNGGSSILNETNLSSTAFNGNTSLFTAGTSTVNFAGSSQSIAGTGTPTFYNLTVSNTSTKTFTNIPAVIGVFSIEGTATVSAAPTYGSGATLQYNTATPRAAGPEWITPFVASGGVVIANAGTIAMNADKVFNSTAPLTVNSGATLSMSTFLLTLNGNFINNGGTASGTTGGVTIAGTATQSIGAYTTTGTVSMTKTGGTATFTGNTNGAGLTINGTGGTLNMGVGLTHTFTGVVTLTAGSLNGGSSSLNENAVSATAWNGTGSVFTAASGTVNFGAAGNQTIAANSSFFNLAFSGSGNKTLSNATTIVANMSITGAVADLGSITTHASNSLTLGGTAQLTGSWGSTASTATHQNNTYFLSTATGMLNVSCIAPAAPVSGGNQIICSGETIPALTVTVGGAGETAYWYDQASGGALLASATLTYTPASAGTYYAGARTIVTGCASASRTAVTLNVNPLPAVLSLTGSAICTSPGGNGTITSTTSVAGINYQLYNAGNGAQGSAQAGTGSGLTWTTLAAGTGYYVKGTNATTGCNSTSSTVNISTNPDPVALVLTGSTICTTPGGDGTITSSTSVTGINYQLYNGSNAAVQSPQAGTGSSLEWFTLAAGTGYYVKGTNATTSCVSSSSNTVDVATVANPLALVLTGSAICVSPGTNGTITSSTSVTGVNYQLFDNTDTEVGTPLPGTGSGLTWTSLPISTGYYVLGTNSTTLCVSGSSNLVDVATTPNPTITSSATATALCFSAGSQSSALAYTAVTNSPTTYTITWNAAAHTAGLVDVTSTSLPAAPNSLPLPVAAGVAAGTYTGTLNVFSGSCSNAGNSFTMAINSAPAAPTGSATQIFCSGATVLNLSATGTSVLWYAAASGGSALATSTALVNGTHYYASQTVSGCESSSRLNVTVIVVSAGSWIGTTGTNWFTTTNWCGGAIPLSSTNVTIAAGLTNYPSIGTTGAVCNNITIESGASLTITGSNTLTVSGSWTNNGTFTANSSTVDFTGSGTASIGACNFSNVTFSGSGTKTATGILTIAGNVSISNNFTPGSFTHTVGGNWTNSGTFTAAGSTIDFNGSGTGSIGAGNFNNVTFSGAGVKTAAGALAVAGNVSITNNFTAGSFTHTVGGNWTKSGTFAATGSTIDFNGSGAGNIGAGNFNNIIFSGAGVKTAAGILTIAGNTIISVNFSAGSYTHSLRGSWTNNGTFTSNTSTVNFIGASAKSIGGSSSTTFNNMIQAGIGEITLGIATSVSGTLTLTTGLVTLGTYNLTTGAITGGSASAFVKTNSTGRLKQTVAGAGGSKTYPVGNSAYNPITVQYNDLSVSDIFSIRVADGAITNANSSKTVSRKWFLVKDAAGSADLTLTMTYNTGEEGTGFSNSITPKIGYFDGSSWAYRTITSGSGTTTFVATGSAPDFSSATGFFALGSDNAFNASKFAVTSLNPVNPSVGIANTDITVQSQNSNSVPTMVGSATGFSLSAANTTMSTVPSGTISQYGYQTVIPSITFTTSTYNTGTSSYNHNATLTATQTSGESLSAGTSAVFDVYEGTIYEPVANENWDATNGWKKSKDGGSTWTNPATLPAGNDFATNDLIRVPVGITLTANVTASFYSMLVYGTVDVSSSGALTLNHSSYSDYNIHVQEGTLKNSGGTLTNNNGSYPTELFEIHGGTYQHAMNGGSIPVCSWSTATSASTCLVTGITSAALTSGLNQTFENFTWNNASQSATQNLSADMTVTGALTLTAGKITTGAYYVIVGLNGTASNSGAGYISGNLRRYVSGAVTTGEFPVGDANAYAPFSISCAGTPTGNGYIDVSTGAAQPPFASGLSQSKYINRKWTISNNGVTGITAYSPACTFVDADKVGSPTTGSLRLRKLTSGTWYTTNGAASLNTITATGLSTAGLTATSDFYVGEDDCSSANAVWLGSTSTDWNTATNWCSGLVPAATTDVTIPSSPARQPVVGSAGGACKSITIQGGASLGFSGAYTLDVHAAWSNSGTFTAGTGTVSFTGSAAQTITGATAFNNLTIDNGTGVTAANDITVTGNLALTSANPDATHGTLDMATYTLSMPGASAGVTGTGDVTGIVKRHHTFTPNIQYQFGSQYTSLNFLNTGTQPDEISCKITIGAAPSWKAGAVKRVYSFAQTGASGTDEVTVNLQYLPGEIQSNTEAKLVLWDNISGSGEEHGKTNNSTTNHWVGLSGFNIAYVAPATLDNSQWGLADYTTVKNAWTGASTTDWNLLNNWSGGHVPYATDDVLIPDVSSGSNRFPVLSSNVEVKTIEIAAGATLTAGTYNMAVNGYQNAWQNNGTFVPGTGTAPLHSTVSFTHGILADVVTVSGTTQFNNLGISPNTFIKPGTGCVTRVSGDVSGDLSSIVDLSALGTTVEYNGTGTQYIVNPSTIGYGYTGYYNLIFSGAGTKILVSDLDISGDFTNNATFDVNGGTVSFIGTAVQTISGSVAPVFDNLTISNAAGVSSAIDFTVNGTLYLQSGNPPSLDRGTLAMDAGKILNLGVDAVTTGTSDVSGIIKRTNTFLTSTFYSFGNANQGLLFPVTSGQTLPTSLTMKVTVGTAPCWGTSCADNPANVTRRSYELAQTGGLATKAILRLNYQDNELASGVNESLLSVWSYISPTVTDRGWSNYDIDLNYISISEFNVGTYTSTIGSLQAGIAPTSSVAKTWNGSVSTDWNTATNWTPNGVPASTLGVVIPDANTTSNQPTLPAYGSAQATCQYLIIESNGVLNSGAGDNAVITIVDGIIGNAWACEPGGTFNAGNSTVLFSLSSPADVASVSGSADFYNVTIDAASKLRPAAGSYMGIAGTLTNNGTFSAATNENTIEFKGSGTQVIPNPNGGQAGYHNLVLSGSGTKTLPSTLNIVDEFTNNATGTVSSAVTAVFDGIVYGQAISGTTPTTFTNLTINNIYGLTLNGVDLQVDGTLTFTAGKITTGANRLIVGSSTACTAGTVSGAGAGKYVSGNLRRYVPVAAAPTVTYDVGDDADYTPVSVAFAGSVSACGYLDVSTVASQPPFASGLSQTKYVDRKWTVSNTGVAGFTSFSPTFTFVTSDIMGGATTSALVIGKLDGTTWSNTTTGTRTATSTQCTGLTSFSDFYIGESDCSPTNAIWLGSTSTDWNTATNWCSGSVPVSTTNVTIPSSPVNQPVIGSAGGTCNNITIQSGATLSISGTYTMEVKANWTNSGTFTAGTGIVSFSGSSAQTIGGATTFATLKVNNAAGVTPGAAISTGSLTIGDVTSNSLFSDGGYQVTATGTLSLVSGTLRIGTGASATAYPSFATNTIASGATVDYGSASLQTIAAMNYGNLSNSGNGNRTLAPSGTIGISGAFTPGTGSYAVSGSTVDFNAAASQTVNGMIYNNLTISGSGNNNKAANGNITVNGILNLSSANYSDTHGALHMGQTPDLNEYILYMGAGATTTGNGDVSGFVNRSSFLLNTDYSFGNQFTIMKFTVEPLPTSVTVELYLTSSDIPWKPNAIHRYYDVTRTGGSAATRLRFNVHYLESELNGATEGNLDLFDYHMDNATVHDHGFTDYNTTDKWVGFSNVGLAFLGTAVADDHFWTLGTSTTNSETTWFGGSPSGPTDWDLPGNWEGGVPRTSSHAVIPAGCSYYPVLPDRALPDGSFPDGRIITSIDIKSGGALDASANTTILTITGATRAWTCQGTLVAGTGNTIVFTNAAASITGETDFNNVTVANGATLTPETGNIMRVAGTVSLATSGVLGAATNVNTIGYNKSGAQTVVNPNGSPAGYSTLILSGSGVKTMPGSSLNIGGDFSMTESASATAAAGIATAGSFTLGSGNSFTAGNYSHSIGGDFENNGATFTTAGSTYTFNGSASQVIGGTASSSSFNNLVLNNAGGAVLGNNITVNGALTLTSGRLSLGSKYILLGSSAVAGTLNSSNMIVADGTGECRRTYTGNGSYTFPVGDATGTAEYSPVTLNFTSGSYASAWAGVRLVDEKHPRNASTTNYLTRYWTMSSSGISSFACNVAGTYVNADIAGTETSQAAGKYDASLPWLKYSTLGSNTLSATGVTAFSDFTGITKDPPSVTIAADPALAVCTGTTVTLTAGPAGDASFTYLWSQSDAATAAINTMSAGTYSVTVTDGNGFTATNSANVTIYTKHAISGNFNYYNMDNTPLTSGIVVKLFQGGLEIPGYTVTVTDGTYSFADLCPGTYQVRATSTASTDGSINTTDAGMANSWGASPSTIEKVKFYAGDVNLDGSITATDAQRIQANFVNNTSFTRPDWTFWNAGTTISSNPGTETYPVVVLPDANKTVNFYGLCTGDFNRSFTPGAKKSASATLQLVYEGALQARSNREFELPLRLVHASRVGAVSLILNFPSGLAEVKNVRMNSAGGNLAWTVRGNELRISWHSDMPAGLASSETMLFLELKTKEAFVNGASIRLTLASDPLNELADEQFEVIGDAVLSVAVVEASPDGIEKLPVAERIFIRNFPNPFDTRTVFEYSLPYKGMVTIEIQSILGKTMKRIISEYQGNGRHAITFDATQLAPGVYTATIRLAGDNGETHGTVKLIKTSILK